MLMHQQDVDLLSGTFLPTQNRVILVARVYLACCLRGSSIAALATGVTGNPSGSSTMASSLAAGVGGAGSSPGVRHQVGADCGGGVLGFAGGHVNYSNFIMEGDACGLSYVFGNDTEKACYTIFFV